MTLYDKTKMTELKHTTTVRISSNYQRK